MNMHRESVEESESLSGEPNPGDNPDRDFYKFGADDTGKVEIFSGYHAI